MLFLGLAGWLFDWGTALVNLIASLYIDFAPTFPGSILGAIWGLIDDSSAAWCLPGPTINFKNYFKTLIHPFEIHQINY